MRFWDNILTKYLKKLALAQLFIFDQNQNKLRIKLCEAPKNNAVKV